MPDNTHNTHHTHSADSADNAASPLPPDATALVVDGLREDLMRWNNEASVALSESRPADALPLLSLAAASLTADEDHLAPPVYENLAIALMRLGHWRPAIRALLRALDGDPTSRQLSARLLPVALYHDHKPQAAQRAIQAYQAAFGPHPDF